MDLCSLLRFRTGKRGGEKRGREKKKKKNEKIVQLHSAGAFNRKQGSVKFISLKTRPPERYTTLSFT